MLVSVPGIQEARRKISCRREETARRHFSIVQPDGKATRFTTEPLNHRTTEDPVFLGRWRVGSLGLFRGSVVQW